MTYKRHDARESFEPDLSNRFFETNSWKEPVRVTKSVGFQWASIASDRYGEKVRVRLLSAQYIIPFPQTTLVASPLAWIFAFWGRRNIGELAFVCEPFCTNMLQKFTAVPNGLRRLSELDRYGYPDDIHRWSNTECEGKEIFLVNLLLFDRRTAHLDRKWQSDWHVERPTTFVLFFKVTVHPKWGLFHCLLSLVRFQTCMTEHKRRYFWRMLKTKQLWLPLTSIIWTKISSYMFHGRKIYHNNRQKRNDSLFK